MGQYLVVGLGKSGVGAARFLVEKGEKVLGVDDQLATLPSALTQELKELGVVLTSSQLIHWQSIDRLILSPGVAPTHPLVAKARSLAIPLCGEVQLACEHLRNRAIGVTGSNGKTTTTLLITHILNRSGFKAKTLGNVGVPLTSAILSLTQEEIAVVELSSYQLETMSCQSFDVGLLLNISPNHLDRYPSFESYARTKFHLRHCLKEGGQFYLWDTLLKEFSSLSSPDSVKTFGFSQTSTLFCDLFHLFYEQKKEATLTSNYQGRASVDLKNLMAAYCACRSFKVSAQQFFLSIQDFRKPAHRQEVVRHLEGVVYVNDSKATSVDAVIQAVESFPSPIVLIAGGVHKGASYGSWLEAFAGKVHHVCVIGQAAEQIQREIGDKYRVSHFSSLKEAVVAARNIAKAGSCVLFSPGCSSFDMFRDYEERGDRFKELVHQL